jgi:hypothetical protein
MSLVLFCLCCHICPAYCSLLCLYVVLFLLLATQLLNYHVNKQELNLNIILLLVAYLLLYQFTVILF